MTKTVAEKLQTKPGNAVFVGPLEDQRELLQPLPEGARFVEGPEEAEVLVLFAQDRAHLEALLDQYLPSVGQVRAPWVAYRKGNVADINRDSIYQLLQGRGWQVTTNVAVDDQWSALRMKRVG